MRASCCALAGVLCVVASAEAFVVSPNAAVRCRLQPRRQQTKEIAAEPDATTGKKKWDGKSWPSSNEKRVAVPGESKSWEMENTHIEVWEDRPNPVDDVAWWENYTPSQEEMDAAAAGFDWTEEWFESAGINPEDPPAAKTASEE